MNTSTILPPLTEPVEDVDGVEEYERLGWYSGLSSVLVDLGGDIWRD